MTEGLDKREWFVQPIHISLAAELVERYHYARGMSHTAVFCFGLFPKAAPTWCYGTTVWLPPTRATAISVNAGNPKGVLSLSRMVVDPRVLRNACSFMLSRAVKAIRKDGRFSNLVTYADERQRHTGLVYKASGWTYVGTTGPYTCWIDPASGKQVSSYSTRTRSSSEMLAAGYVRAGRYFKHKYTLAI